LLKLLIKGEFNMNKWQKFILMLVVGLMLIAPFGAAGLAAPAQVAAQPAAQLACVVQALNGGWYVCLPDLPTTNVNWNS
jgi:hypothetical protein